jgi:hypothetical protein
LRDRLPSGAIRVIFGGFMVIVALRLLGEAFGVF